jgi:predicted DNA-binding WGR domain protein
MRIYMQTLHSPEQPLRFYHLHLQPDLLGGWSLVRESGLQGGRGQVKKEHFSDRTDAERSLIRHRDMQLKRGYRVVFREGIPHTTDD